MPLFNDYPNLRQFPRLVEVVKPEVIEAELADLKPAYLKDRAGLRANRKKHSKAFWNTMVTAAAEPDDGRRAWADYLLTTVEEGLEQADRCKKASSFRNRLTVDGDGFWQVLAELRVLGCVGPLAEDLDLERPGSKPGKNYDFYFKIDGVEVHADSKWRTETPLGEVDAKVYFDIEDLLCVGFDALAIGMLAENRLSDENALDIALLIDGARELLRADNPGWVQVDKFTAHEHLTGLAYDEAIPYLVNPPVPQAVFAASIEGVSTAYLTHDKRFLFDSNLLREAKILQLLDEGAKGACFLMPKSESQPVFDASTNGVHDVAYPEHMRITDLVSSVHQQLPTAPFNLVLVGTMDRELLYDVELAMLGVHNNGDRKGGVFEGKSFDALSGAVGFTLIPPHPTRGDHRAQWAKYWPNGNAAAPLDNGLAVKLAAALGEDPGDLSGW